MKHLRNMRKLVFLFFVLALGMVGNAQSRVTRTQIDADGLAMEEYYAKRNEAWSSTGQGTDPDNIPKPDVFIPSFFYPSTLRVILRTNDASANAIINKVKELVLLRADGVDYQEATEIYKRFSVGLEKEGYVLLMDANQTKQWLGDQMGYAGVYGIVKNGNITKGVLLTYFIDQPFYIIDFTGDISFNTLGTLATTDIKGIFKNLDTSFLKSLTGNE